MKMPTYKIVTAIQVIRSLKSIVTAAHITVKIWLAKIGKYNSNTKWKKSKNHIGQAKINHPVKLTPLS